MTTYSTNSSSRSKSVPVKILAEPTAEKFLSSQNLARKYVKDYNPKLEAFNRILMVVLMVILPMLLGGIIPLVKIAAPNIRAYMGALWGF